MLLQRAVYAARSALNVGLKERRAAVCSRRHLVLRIANLWLLTQMLGQESLRTAFWHRWGRSTASESLD